jgi:type IV pilus assembly protein PilW
MFGILTTAGYSLFREQTRINQAQQNQLEMQSSARAAMQVLIQAFSHAGFGCSEKISGTNEIAGEETFLIHTNQNFSGTTPDSVTLIYGFDHVATTTASITDTNIIPIDNSTDIGTTEYSKYISFYPSLAPNSFYTVTAKASNSVTIDSSLSSLRTNAKVFRVNPVDFYVNGAELRQRFVEHPAGLEEVLIYDVQDFQLAYTEDDENLGILANWEDDPGNPENVKAVWIYMILRTREIEPGHQETRTFRLPWAPGQTFEGSTLPAGFHYQEFQTQVWLRNAN